MEFCEKLQALRKSRGLTQEELAEALYVSRAAVSKWEQGRGYPSIDSLKDISGFFSITIDELLSAEKLIFIAEKEHRSSIREMMSLLFGMTDLFAMLLVALPLYPKTADGYVYSVALIAYTETTALNRLIYWVMFLGLVLLGIGKLLLTWVKAPGISRILTGGSVALNIAAVAFLALAGETYGVVVAFLLLLIKGMLLFRTLKDGP